MTVHAGGWVRAKGVGCLVVAGVAGSGALAAEEAVLTPEFRADIERLMEVTNAADMGAQMGNLVAQQVVQMSGAETPEAVRRCREIAAEVVGRALADQDLVEEVIPIYAKHFSHEDIRQMIAFHETPLGRKSIEVMPRLMAESMQVGQRWAAKTLPRIREEVTKQMRDEELIE